MIAEAGIYRIELDKDENYSVHSSDNLFKYDRVYFEQSQYDFPTQIGLKIYERDKLIRSAIIGSVGGGIGIHENSQIIEHDRIIICCSDSLFCLSIPKLNLIWKTKADQATCFELFKYKESYIVHGEMEISRIDMNGQIMWRKSGADIFTTPKGQNDFEITETYIGVTDWGNRTYNFDFEGRLIE